MFIVKIFENAVNGRGGGTYRGVSATLVIKGQLFCANCLKTLDFLQQTAIFNHQFKMQLRLSSFQTNVVTISMKMSYYLAFIKTIKLPMIGVVIYKKIQTPTISIMISRIRNKIFML